MAQESDAPNDTPDDTPGDPIVAFRKAISDAEAAELYTNPEDSFAVLMMASASYVHDTNQSDNQDNDRSGLAEFTLEVVHAFRQVAHLHSRGEIAFALIGLVTSVVSDFRHPGPVGTVLTAEMISEARMRLIVQLMDTLTHESIAGIVMGLGE